MVEYTIKVKNRNGNFIGEFETFRNLKYSKNLNGYGSCSFEVPLEDSKAGLLVVPRGYSVYVYRRENKEYEGDLVWAGEQVLRTANLKADNDNWLEVYCYDWFEQLYHRFTAQVVQYDQIDAGAIAWDLINDSQNDSGGYGGLGITQGTITATMNRDRTYYNQNIGKAIENLANVISGFDFEITNDKKFNVYSIKGEDKSEDVVFQLGLNVKEMNIKEDFINPVNRAIVLGEATDTDELQRIERVNTDFMKTYGLRESLISEMDIEDLATLEDRGDALLRKYQLPLITLSMSILESSAPNITDFELGDLIKIVAQKGFYDINNDYRVFGYEVSLGNSNEESLKLILGDFTSYGT